MTPAREAYMQPNDAWKCLDTLYARSDIKQDYKFHCNILTCIENEIIFYMIIDV